MIFLNMFVIGYKASDMRLIPSLTTDIAHYVDKKRKSFRFDTCKPTQYMNNKQGISSKPKITTTK